MATELKTAEQLSEIIVGALGVKEVYVSVRKDHAYPQAWDISAQQWLPIQK
jgi:hypothetical protein